MDFQVVGIPLPDRLARHFVPCVHGGGIAGSGPAQFQQLLARQTEFVGQRRDCRGRRNRPTGLESRLHHGPVLAAPDADRTFWLVPLDAPEELADVRQLVVHPADWALSCPPTGRQVDGRFWFWRPDGSGHLTEPALLAAAFGPGRHRHPTEASA